MMPAIPTLSTVFIVCDLLLGLLIPALLFRWFKKRGLKARPFIVGCLVFLVMALLLEQLAHLLILSQPFGVMIQTDPLLTALYGGLMAGLFEEGGRALAFALPLARLRSDDRNALMYGAGHGGMEVFYILAVSMGINLVLIAANSSGQLENLVGGSALPALQESLTQLAALNPLTFLAAPLERLAALTAQMSLSVLVWFAVKKPGCRALLPLAVVLHLLLDAAAVLLNSAGVSVVIIELLVWLLAAAYAACAVRVWRRQHAAETDGSAHADAAEIAEAADTAEITAE